MNPTLIDTDILSLFLRGDPIVIRRIEEYLTSYGKLNLSIITYYEIVSGLRHRDANKQIDRFLELAYHNNILPLTESACDIAAVIYANLRKTGIPLDDIDLRIAGTGIG